MVGEATADETAEAKEGGGEMSPRPVKTKLVDGRKLLRAVETELLARVVDDSSLDAFHLNGITDHLMVTLDLVRHRFGLGDGGPDA